MGRIRLGERSMPPNSRGDRTEMGTVVPNDSELRSVSFPCRLM